MSQFYIDLDNVGNTFNSSNYITEEDIQDNNQYVLKNNGVVTETLIYNHPQYYKDSTVHYNTIQMNDTDLNVLDSDSNVVIKLDNTGDITCNTVNNVNVVSEQTKLTNLKSSVDTLFTGSVSHLDTLGEISTLLETNEGGIADILENMADKASITYVDTELNLKEDVSVNDSKLLLKEDVTANDSKLLLKYTIARI